MLPVSRLPSIFTKADILQLIEELDTDPLKNSGVRPVHPVGDGSSKVMLIGEAPGEQEDKLGEPFVGASGKFLNNILLPSVGLTRQNIYLTNIVKCRLPENRDPTSDEKLAWSIVLLLEISVIEPEVIICLGRHSLDFFLKDAKISKVHGQPQQVELFEGIKQTILPLYHPAVALYDPSMRQVLQQDFLKTKEFIKEVGFSPKEIEMTETKKIDKSKDIFELAEPKNSDDGSIF